MRIQFVSDLHLEHRGGGDLPTHKIGVAAPTLVLAGDVGRLQSRAYRALLEWVNARFEHTFLVLGNHEFYGVDCVQGARRQAAAAVEGLPRVHWLDRSTYDHPSGVRFAGATLWSAIAEDGFGLLLDRKNIRWSEDAPFTRDHYLDMHRRDRAFFEAEIARAAAEGTPLVCVSHHAPLREMNGSFGDDPRWSGFCTDLAEPLLRPPVRAWISGHTHQSLRVVRNGVQCVANCLGYPAELGCDPGFRVGACVQVCAPTEVGLL